MATKGTLLALPAELLLQVSSYLTTMDLCSLRRSCKDVEGTLRHSFTREFFTKRQFMLEEISLQALVDISLHPVYSKSLQEVIISLHSIQHTIPPHLYDELLHQHGHLAQDVLISTGQARDMLVAALSRLPNLQSINLRDYNARGRLRDGDRASWKSYGWTYDGRVGDLAQHGFNRAGSAEGLYATAFGLVLHALGLANSTPERFEVFFRHGCDDGVGLPLHGLRVLNGPLAGAVKRVLQGLKVLMLTLAGPDSSIKELLNVRPSDIERLAHPLRRLLENTPNLEKLRLNFSPDQVCVQAYLEWFATPASVTWSNLTCLDIGMICLKESLLTNVIAKFNLTELNLWKITLISTHEDGVYSPWIALLQALTISSKLNARTMKKMTIGYPNIESSGRPGSLVPVYFVDEEGQSFPTRNAAYNSSTDGTDFTQWAEALAKKVSTALDTERPNGHHAGLTNLTSDEDEEGSDDESDDEDSELDSDDDGVSELDSDDDDVSDSSNDGDY
jgi:hypothetical protein